MSDNPNYVKFGPTEMVVQFAADRGEWRAQPEKPDGGYFFRGFADGRRFACVGEDLERRLLDLNYRAGEKVAIARMTRNRSVIWKVRLLEPDAAPAPAEKRTPPPLPVVAPPAREPQRPVRAIPQSIPQAKYAPPPVIWPETAASATSNVPKQTVSEKKPNGTAAAGVTARPEALNGTTLHKNAMKQFLYDAIDIAVDAQAHAAAKGLLFTPGFAEIQDLATSLFIQQSKQDNIAQMDRNQQRRAAGGQDPWRH